MCEDIPFKKEDWVLDRKKPGSTGQYTGICRKVGPHIMLQIRYPGGATNTRPLTCLEPYRNLSDSIYDQLKSGKFGGIRDLQRLITYEKLKGTLHEVIYSMDAAQIDFFPYQFKPVLKFINSPTERLIIADEVGLGKTIESALIWIELQARKNAKRLLVLCPRKILSEKWRKELRTKFLIDAKIVNFENLKQELNDLHEYGPSHSFNLIATYSGLRSPKPELGILNNPPEEKFECSEKTLLLRKLRYWENDFDPFDMVIFDEAHYMRNPGSSTFKLGESLAARAGSVLCVSATPVNNSNIDLHTLLRLIDVDFFETQAMFDELLNANKPAVQASNALARTPPDLELLKSAVIGMTESAFISKSPLFKLFIEKLENIDIKDLSKLAKLQDLSEKLNLLGSYVNRTRRVQVKENRPVRVPKVLIVEYSPEEMLLYDTILSLIRRKCQLDKRPFHIFQLMGVQLRAASCLPVIAQEIKNEKFGNTDKLFDEGFYYGIEDDFIEPNIDIPLAQIPIGSLLNYNFEINDSKYKCLKNLLEDLPDDEKIIIFAYYRPTLSYLKRRLVSDGFTVSLIHGGITTEQRMEELDRFEDKRGPMILLSSEVGSEGIDLQFCRIMVNYDLPWNPMRVEQRIGRIDRVGQQAKRLSIVNFKIRDTIEERLYDRLHSKLEKFANSLGDLEAIIGQEVKKMTVELLSKKLTPQEEARVMELSEKVIEDRLIKMQALEESGDALIAFSDYVQQKIENDKYKGRYILSEELEDYLIDFFEREFQGCEVIQNTPINGCLSINLTYEAHHSLISFIGDNRTLSTLTFRQNKFNITFRRDVMKRLSKNQTKTVSFINHLSPLMRWITEVNKRREHNFYNVSALSLTHPKLATGNYCYRIERWKLLGLFKKEMLAFGIKHLENGSSYIGDEAENIFQSLLRNGKDWDYVDCDCDKLCQIHSELEIELSEMFALAVEDFEAENTTNHQIKIQRVSAHFDRRISNDKIRLRSLRAADRAPHMIHMTEKRIENIKNNKLLRINEINNTATTDIEASEIAAGLFRII